ncbi:protocadherin-23 [Candoia aspera]|uniref:protocadherin-23 n=1 Tax=Candoia aspera TaxID=51853 RepID=UPI002FD82CCB
MALRPLALRMRKRWQKLGGGPVLKPWVAGRWLIPLWLCLSIAGRCSAQVYNLSLGVDEELPADTLVGDISAGLPHGEAHPGGFFLSEGSGESALLADFHVHTDTGIILTARPLDRERRARYSFAAATLRGQIVQVEITISDVNDHAPRFPREVVYLNISELSPPGSAFRLPAARDPDEGSFGIWGYSLLPWDLDGAADDYQEEEGPFFQLRYGPSSSEPLDLLLLRRLDREQADTHRLLVEAWDSGSPRRSGRLRVEIQVLDENDNAPTFGQSEYRARLRENAPAGTSVCRVFATDPDLGGNGDVRYVLSRRQGDSSAGTYFEVGERTGLLRLRRPLDREVRSNYHLAVEARDGGAQPEVATAWIAVEVLDVNDNAPVIHLLYLTESGATVSEGARSGDYIARVSVSDRDEQQEKANGEGTPGGGVVLSLEGGEGTFSLRRSGGDSGIYFLCVEGPLDRETCDVYELRLMAVDAGVPPLFSQHTLALRVADLNDQAPAFAQPSYRATVSEAASPGTVVLRLSASDADEPGSRNSQVRYALAPSQAHGALFLLDQLSGVLSIRAALDHEREALVQLWALARDLGVPPLSASCLVSISVEDANDNEPVFKHQVYNVSCAEHSEVGDCLLQVKATDQDSGHFGHIEYFLYNGFHNNEKSEAFQIDINSGCIYLSQDVDREEDPSTYDFLVKAIDGGGLSAQAFVHIEIEDINDNRPVFNPATYVISISSHTQPGTEITNLHATDKDSGIYGAVTYELIPGHLSSLFKVDPSTGIVYLISSLSNADCSSVLLTVSAQDGGGLWSVVNAVVTVRILQTAVAPAVFEHSYYSFSIPEDAPEGSSVGTVKAKEPLNFLETISYRISSGNSYGIFTIDSHYGIIRTKKQLDHETHDHIVLTVQSQLGSSSVFSSAQVNITVIDINDNRPVFMKESDHIYISQSTVPGTALYIAHAEDKDSGLNGAIHYAIVSSQSSVFTIDPALGILYLARDLSGQKQHEHVVVHIRAEDHGIPPLSSVLILGVLIDKQKGSPVLTFEKLLYQVEVSEESCLGTRILQIQAWKLNPQHTSANLIYSLEHNIDSVSFKIDPETGVVYLQNSLDYEHLQTHSFRAFVTSSVDKSVQNASTLIIVNVIDENDNSPVFVHGTYFIEVEEKESPQGLVGTIKAIDKDSGRNGHLSYFILSNENYFKINSNTGEIINWVALDHEQQAHHHLVALVIDHGVPQRNTTISVYISVTDLNDNQPCFSQHLPHFKILERQPAGTLVTNIFAKDLDSGNNGLVLYSISSEGSLGHFQIDSSSGELRTTEALLYNWHSNYRMIITASDKGDPPLQGETVIGIEVIPLPKGRSFPSQYIRHFVIPENFRPAQIIGSLKLPGQHSYSNRKQHFIIPEEDSDIPFEIDNATGDLFLSKELDFEAISHYFFRVLVNDYLNSPPQNETVFLSIDVEDQNDHSPSFQNDFIVIGIEENVPIGTLVYTFSARDGDGSFLNRNLQYSIHRNDFTENPFFIHPTYGTLITAVSLDRERSQFFVLTVLASDQAVNLTERNQCSLTAKIVILDVNDNSPSFVSSPLSYIREDAEVGSIAHHIIAQDPDQGRNGQITYLLLSSNEDRAFLIDKATGVLTTAFALDREHQEYYNLTVVALDNGSPALSAAQNLTIIVLDVNDEAPVFTKAIYEASIWENRAPGVVGIKVEAIDKDSGINSLLKYDILPGPGYENFQINPYIGEIRTTISLDREIQEVLHIKVLVQDGGTPTLSSTASIVFRVLDENDHTPKIIFPVSDIQIMENQVPSTITTLLAVDDDTANNGIVRYQIIGGNIRGYFALHKISGDLFTTHSLDREIVNNFTLVIECLDLGNPPRSSVMELRITVLDENDNSPLFTRNHYQAIISEDIKEKSAILELFAVDADEGPNGKVVYSLMGETLGLFTINRNTGVVITNKPMDREKQSRYIFKALATDSDVLQPRSTSVTIIIHIEDVNDNNPFFLENPLEVQISPQTNINQTIATMQSSDLDLGPNGTVNFRFVTPTTVFEIDPNTGEIFLQEPVSYDGLITHLLIVAYDQGIPARTATAVVTICSKAHTEKISFSHTQYETKVPENSETGTSVFTVVTHDRSLVGNNVKYTIISEHEDIFYIHPIMGEVTVKQTEFLDYEIRKEVHFAVLAENGLASAVCSVTVFLQDINDNTPQFEQSYIRVSVWEGQVYDSYITQIYATDSDSGQNGEIEYSILFGNINEVFLIDSAQGIISTNRILDREDISLYRLIIQAADRGIPRLFATCTVEIEVVDINDNAPTLQPLGVIKLSENTPVGFLVIQVVADDADLGPPLHYSFAEDYNHGNKFAIDQWKGTITLVKTLDFEINPQLELLINISDSVHQTIEQLQILISDVNDNPPVFTQDAYQVIIPELRSIDDCVLTVYAIDKDSEHNGKIFYRIISASDTFFIDPENGSLFLVNPLTYQNRNPEIRLLVEASDNGNPPLTAVTSVAVQIQAMNIPQFTVETYNLTVSENASVGERLFTFSVIDQDRNNQNTHVVYSIIGGNDDNKFYVEMHVLGPEYPDQMIGKLVLRSTLDRERCSSYQLLILASDHRASPLKSTATVSITILDVNDNPPVFTSLEYHVHVREDFPVGNCITSVSAYDYDAETNADITYSIASGNDKEHFQLEGKTGSIHLIRALDYEDEVEFNLTVQASDGGIVLKHVAFAVVFISVLDVNDYVPIFVFPSLTCGIHENMPAFSSVCTISALDFDTGPCGYLSYSIQSSCLSGHGILGDHNPFIIDPLSGDIRTKQVLDFEHQSKYCFIAQAKDKSNSTATVTVQINVEGLDEFHPVFNQDEYLFYFPDKNEAGQLIGNVTASDCDGGLDGVIYYALLKQSSFFSVNYSSGAVYLTRSFHRKRSNMKKKDHTLELLIKAHSPKQGSKSSTCTVLVNISNSPESYSTLPAYDLSVSIATSTIAFLFLVICLAVLIGKYTLKDICRSSMEKAMPYSSVTDLNMHGENNTPKHSQKSQIHGTTILPVGNIADWLSFIGIRDRRDIDNVYIHSNPHSHGSREGETGEDEEIKKINEHPCRKGTRSALNDKGSCIPDSGIPRDSDQLSCQSGENEVLAASQSTEAIHYFKDGSGEQRKDCSEMLYDKMAHTLAKLTVKEIEIMTDLTMEYIIIPDNKNSYYGSLATLVDSDEDLGENYNWDYLLNWEPSFKPLASVFSDIAELEDESIKVHNFPKKEKSFIFPPPLLTSSAQLDLKSILPQMPTSLPDKGFKKYPHSPVIHPLKYPPALMTPSFSPSLSLLTMQTPTASPVASYLNLKGMCSSWSACELSTEEEVQEPV